MFAGERHEFAAPVQSSLRAVGRIGLLWLLLSMPQITLAWNDTGHMLTALIAYDELPAAVQDDLSRTLRAHPRYAEDFQARMPARVRNASAAEQDRWVFAFAATWPDLARHFGHVQRPAERAELVERYHRGPWHYINLPTFLNEADQHALGALTVNQSDDWTRTETERLNAVQALGMLTDQFSNPGVADEERAVTLCWLLHLVGDIHQPLHTTALFTSRAFPEGDRGGNSLTIAAGTNLHSLWDGAVGSDTRWTRLLDRRAALLDSYAKEPSAANERSLPERFGAWAEEGAALARSAVYVPEILAQVAAENTRQRRSVRITLPAGYEEQMQDVAEAQVVLAGRRMARLLEQISSKVREQRLPEEKVPAEKAASVQFSRFNSSEVLNCGKRASGAPANIGVRRFFAGGLRYPMCSTRGNSALTRNSNSACSHFRLPRPSYPASMPLTRTSMTLGAAGL